MSRDIKVSYKQLAMWRLQIKRVQVVHEFIQAPDQNKHPHTSTCTKVRWEQRLEGTGEKAKCNKQADWWCKAESGAKGPVRPGLQLTGSVHWVKMSHGGAEIGSFLGVN